MGKEGWVVVGAVLAGIFVGSAITEILSITHPGIFKELEGKTNKLAKDVKSSCNEAKKRINLGIEKVRDTFLEGYAEAF